MSTVQEHRFSKGFILDENKISRIHEVLIEKIATYQNHPEIEFQIFKADSSYITQEIQKVFKEDNSGDDKITELRIRVRNYNSPKLFVSIYFGNNFSHTTYLEVEGDDPNLVSSIFYDLKQYLSNKVNVFKGFSRWIEPLAWFIPSLLAYLWWVAKGSISPNKTYLSSQEINAVLKSSDSNKKIDFLIRMLVEQQAEINKRSISTLEIVISITFGILGGLLFLKLYEKLINILKYLFPRNVFLIGEGRNKYEEIKSINKNIFWVIIIGFPISFLASWIFWLFTK